MKAYTDLEQSKTLSKILPIESADMWYHGHCSPWESEREYDSEACPFHSMSPNWDKPSWSLAALLELIPDTLLSRNDDNLWSCKSVGNPIIHSGWFSNPIDACYEMIIKLKENNLI